ncbi:LPS export ABC transporter periplasmic protein LptC [Bradyrhizobium viridifuturi]|uniref:LPS export ABC transporter periplasmic protein LptC n=1 Tax=Bradyrhizobium viridifuturi TaxID=1654716 RepID=UPI000A8D138A
MNSVQNPAYVTGLEARFAAAARHSRMVRILRVAVPAVVGVAMASIIFVSVYNPFREMIPKLPVEMDNLVVSGTKITMESPHIAGFSADGRPYEMWAKAAIQDVTDPDHVELKTIRAKVAQQDESTVTMDARTGFFDNKKQLLDLRQDIFLQSSTGYEAKLTQAFVDINKGNVSSDEHVDVKLLQGTLTSDRLRIYNSGELVRFEGNVVMYLDKLGDNNASAPAEAAPPPPPPPPAPPKRANPPTRNDFDDQTLSARHRNCGLPARAVRSEFCVRAGLDERRPQRHAGLFAEP